MLASFIIPAHDEAAVIGRTLDSIRRAARDLPALQYEVIVADDASTDDTANISRARGASVVRHERRQISATRNLGARAATGDALIFIDADTQVTTPVLRETMDLLRAGNAGGGAIPDFDGALPRHARIILPVFLAAFRLLNQCGGAYVFCTRPVYEASGGWDETVFAGEELLFIKAIKRHGRFRLTRSRVVTSGRKLRTHSAWEIYGFLLKAVVKGRGMVRDRTHLDLWYGPRRADTGGLEEPA